MLIRVIDRDTKIVIPLPNLLIFNPLSALLVKYAVRRHVTGLHGMSYQQICRLMRSLRHSKRKIRGLPLVEVHESDGTEVLIKL